MSKYGCQICFENELGGLISLGWSKLGNSFFGKYPGKEQIMVRCIDMKNKRISEYGVASGYRLEELVMNANLLIQNGWQPMGTFTVEQGVYSLSMVKYEFFHTKSKRH